ncbi:TonB-dependent receptor [Novosphingobium guangzhouense]|uniref:TonB-dependent receptor n=1 Tax=Novosphingobium guangzhouense TaxID=1850347 RepID=A0A2K2FY52_9SPHN|nr:TonB-dependent receptor [Novosphingobium guangzhouense]PNU03721.1 TonB-dependent receptor [Novosphingobium guangzhouense]
MRQHVTGISLLKAALFAGSALVSSAAMAQDAAPAQQDATDVAAPAPAPADEAASANDIIVTGFRQSLQAALNVKRDSISAVDAVVAEDMAKFPDQNLAESLQRIPGISIQKDGGEGRAITVRGLGAQFTRVRVNGLETIATSSDGASANRDRAFDFNVFASELFSSLVVHKTAEASLDEGSLGAVVDLNTGNPLAGKKGLTAVLNVQGSYNDLSENVGPRIAGLLSWRNDAGTFGVNLSAAYSHTDTIESGNNSVRWSQAYFNSVNGNPCFYSDVGPSGGNPVSSGGGYRPSASCDEAALSFHPRIPRYGVVEHDRRRLGLTGSIQFELSDKTKFSIDGLYSSFKETRAEQWLEVLARSNERRFDVVDPVYDDNGNMVSATFNNAYVRTESYLRKSETEFWQVGATWDQEISDTFRFTALGGMSQSNADIPVETTFAYDNKNANGFSYDYSDMKSPVLSYGLDVTDPANFQLAEIRDRPSYVKNKFKTAQLRTEWDMTDGLTVKAGAVWRRYDFRTQLFQRDTAACGANGTQDLILGTVTCSSSVYGLPVTSDISQLINLGDAGQPSGTTNQWLVADIAKAAAYTNLYGRTAVEDLGNNRQVRETTSGGYVQFDVKGEIFGLEYAGNAGMRYAHTNQVSTGYTAGIAKTVERSYDDWLPAMNLAFYPHRDVILRGAIAKVITRPSLGNLNPGGSVDGFNYRITFGNPELKPYRATNFDLSVEWYFAPQALFSVAGFVKKIESFPVAGSYESTLPAMGFDRSVLGASTPAYINYDPNQVYVVSTQVNGEGATLKGVEIALQMPFTFLPGILSHTGFQGNATFIDSDADYTITGPAVSACTRNATTNACGLSGVSQIYNQTLLGVSKKAWNATLYYDDGKFSIRGSVSYRGPFVDATSATGNIFEGYGSYTSVDAAIRYKATEWLELSIDGNNLTDEYRYRFNDVYATRSYENNHFGRTILFGARAKI